MSEQSKNQTKSKNSEDQHTGGCSLWLTQCEEVWENKQRIMRDRQSILSVGEDTDEAMAISR